MPLNAKGSHNTLLFRVLFRNNISTSYKGYTSYLLLKIIIKAKLCLLLD